MAALVPKYFPTLTDLHIATRIAQSTLSDWKTGKADPRLEYLEKVVEVLSQRGIDLDPVDLLRPGDETRIEYEDRYPNRAVVLSRLKGLVDDRALKRVASKELNFHGDPSPLHWIKQVVHEVEQIEMEASQPDVIKHQLAEGQRVGDQYSEALRKKQGEVISQMKKGNN
jgi:hypothetical protein